MKCSSVVWYRAFPGLALPREELREPRRQDHGFLTAMFMDNPMCVYIYTHTHIDIDIDIIIHLYLYLSIYLYVHREPQRRQDHGFLTAMLMDSLLLSL